MEQDEKAKLWQEYLQKCCEVGQLRYQRTQVEGQQREIDKHIELAERAVKSLAAKHRDIQKSELEKIKLESKPETPSQEAQP